MPRVYEMSWDGPRERWVKMYRGRRFSVACSVLGVPATKEESYQAANRWWEAKRAEIVAADQPKPRVRRPFEDVVGAMYGPEILTSGAALYRLVFESLLAHGKFLPDEAKDVLRALLNCPRLQTEPLNEELADAVRKVTVEDLLLGVVGEGEPLPSVLQENLPPARLHQLEDATKALRGEPATPTERTVQAQFERWVDTQKALVAAGSMTPARADNARHALIHFVTFLGADADVKIIDAARLHGFYLWCLQKVETRQKDRERKAGWSVAYAREVFAVARSFVRFLWESDLIELPRNANSRTFRFNGGAKVIRTWTPDEVQHVISEAPGQLKLHLLLMVNCGFTQVDISDLRDDEADWTEGRIIRKRSKTGDRDTTPTVNYKLWPETFRLLRKYRSGQERVLLTESGRPFVRTDLVNAKLVKCDSIASNFKCLAKRLKFRKALKQLRKTSATLLESHPEYGRYVSLFLGHSPRTMADRHYAAPSQERFDEAVAWLGSQVGQVKPARRSNAKAPTGERKTRP